MNFKVLNEDVYFPKEFVKLNEIRVGFFCTALDSIGEFTSRYNESFENLEALLKEGKSFGSDFLNKYISKAIDIINQFEVEPVDSNLFLQEYYLNKYWMWDNTIDKISKETLDSSEEDDNNLIVNKEVILDENESVRLNIKSYLIKIPYDVNNANKDGISSEIFDKLLNSMVESIFNIHFAVVDFLKIKGIEDIASYNGINNLNKSNILIDSLLEGEVSKEDEVNVIREIISLTPYNENVYKVLLDKYGDKNNEIEELGDFLGFNNIRQYKYDLLDKYFNSLSVETKEEIIDSKEKLEIYAINLSLDNYDSYLNKLDELVTESESELEVIEDLDIIQSRADKSKVKNQKSAKVKKIELIVLITSGILLTIYLAIALYFNSHLLFRSNINGVSVAGKNLKGANEHMASMADKYVLSLELREDITEEIKGSDISLKYDFNNEISEIIEAQNPFLWIASLFKENNYEVLDNISYDEVLLKQRFGNLQCMNTENMQEPVNAYFNLVGNKFELVAEVMGNKIKEEEFYTDIVKSITSVKDDLSLDEESCYEDPIYKTDTQVVMDAKSTIDKYLEAKITYNYNGSEEVIDSSIIAPWISIDPDFNVGLNEDAIREYVNGLGSIYDNIGQTRTFTRWSGEEIKVSTTPGISYIDRTGTITEIVEAIKSGSEQVKDLSFKTPDQLDDYVINTFVEVDLSNQTVVYYKNGELITQGNIVTGNPSQGNATPPGVFRLDWKASPFVLRGDDYESPVSFWMPFNKGIGLHDANWRSSFGGSIYKTDGSHGCVNMPYSVAQAIYNNIEEKTTIICRY